ncbi:catalase family peroxidase [Massilia sp. CFBP9012]|uniref:catalase family peroxidase n=1 Tax=Massilia sp. CFBP9012 TaxID=3096531 RepID=UPI002A6A4430|nr:catalase family peroxidase [Massilia sp. CFBP9012]MDY0976983.1 catalase family peroxidase [Massilia sp. CFBP9012]
MNRHFAPAMLALCASAAQAQAPIDTGPAALIDALNGTFGSHPGMRASHAKGFCAVGQFQPAKGARDFADGPLFGQNSVPANVRFSVGGGNPKASDKSRSVRGLSMRLASGGETWDLLLISEPAFFAATPESFVSFLQARVPDPATGKPDPAKVAAHNAAHPDGTRQPALLAAHAAPSSYASTPYFSNNAFVFGGRGKKTHHARIVAEPFAPVQFLSADEEKTLPDLFLQDELAKRLGAGPIGFTLYAQLPAAGDSLLDPSTEWQGAGKVELGRLLVKGQAPQDACNGVVYMPLALPTGIAASDDPILHARGAAYAVSLSRRLKQ